MQSFPRSTKSTTASRVPRSRKLRGLQVDCYKFYKLEEARVKTFRGRISAGEDWLPGKVLSCDFSQCYMSYFQNALYDQSTRLCFTSEDLDLVRVHGGVCDENVCVLDALGLFDTVFLVEDEARVEVRVEELAAGLFDNLRM